MEWTKGDAPLNSIYMVVPCPDNFKALIYVQPLMQIHRISNAPVRRLQDRRRHHPLLLALLCRRVHLLSRPFIHLPLAVAAGPLKGAATTTAAIAGTRAAVRAPLLRPSLAIPIHPVAAAVGAYIEEICRDKLQEAIAAIEAIEATRLPATLH